MKTVIETCKVIAGAAILACLGAGFMFIIFSMPVMHVDHATRSCVKVFSDNPEHSCTNPPRRYETVYVSASPLPKE